MDPARSIALEVFHRDTSGQIQLTFEEWRESTIEISFRDRLYRNSGLIQFDGRTGKAIIRSSRPYENELADPQEFDAYFHSILTTFTNAYTFGWSPDPAQMVTYDAEYHSTNNYTQGITAEVEIKEVQARIIREIATPKKCLIAGSSNGELVRCCRAMGMDAYGFDVIPNIRDLTFPEVRDYVRRGSLTHVPFTADDAIDTLVAVDVLEHIPERDLPRMVDEWLRLGIRNLVLLINLNQFWFPGHITLRPLWWWAAQWKEHFHLATTIPQFPHLASVYSNTGSYNQQWTLWSRMTTS
jgi:hypothetical protein